MMSRWKLVVVAGAVSLLAVAPPVSARPKKQQQFNHVVVVMMENRSFDHLLGWHPRADGLQTDLQYLDDAGVPHSPTQLSPADYQGCAHNDPDHSFGGSRIDANDGAMNGFLLNNCPSTENSYCPRQGTTNDEYAIGYYVREDRPFFNELAVNYTVFDNYFASILAETFPNRIFMHSATTDRLTNTFDLVSLPTIWDRLQAKGVSARYYYQDTSFLWLWGNKYDSISYSYDQFLQDAKSGQLPAVSFVEPRFAGEDEGVSGDDHPHADIRAGDAFLSEAFHAVAGGPQWGTTVFIVTYDESGGFVDHVRPPRVVKPDTIDPDDDLDASGKVLLGMRIPVVVASPYTRGDPNSPAVNSTLFDNTSILKMIERRWGLEPLTARDATTSEVGDLTTALNLATPDRRVPSLPTPSAPPVIPCGFASTSSSREPGLGDIPPPQ
jgi:phospholipase C